MNIFFHDLNDIPLPPEAVRVRSVKADVLPGGHRIKLSVELTPFLKPPSISVCLFDPTGEEAASISILETNMPRTEVHLHLPKDRASGDYELVISIYYQQLPDPSQSETIIPEPMIVDHTMAVIQI